MVCGRFEAKLGRSCRDGVICGSDCRGTRVVATPESGIVVLIAILEQGRTYRDRDGCERSLVVPEGQGRFAHRATIGPAAYGVGKPRANP